MLAAVGSVAAAGVFEERSESARARADMVGEQQILATVFASALSAGVRDADVPPPHGRLTGVELDGPKWIFTFQWPPQQEQSMVLVPQAYLHGHAYLEARDHRLLLWSTKVPGLHTLQGRAVTLPAIADKMRRGEAWARLTAEEAVLAGLPHEIAVAGIARADCGPFGTWGVAVISSAENQREREARRSARLVLGVGLVSLIILGFGLALFRTQRHEQALGRELERETLAAQRDAQLARDGRAATVLTFAAGMAHELSTPLGVMAMRAEQIESAAEDERTQRAARIIIEQVARIREQAQRFLSLARGASPSRDRFRAVEILQAAGERVQHRFERAGVALRVDIAEPSLWVRGDARLLEHTLTNLLVNACEASPPGSAVDLVASAGPNELTVTVRDRGAGLDPALQARLGEPFISAKPGGTGLGLAIAHEVMRMHRGELRIESHPEGGTCAVLRLPCERADADNDSTGHTSDTHPAR